MIEKMFSDAGGSKAFDLLLRSKKLAKRDKDLDVIFESANIDLDKARLALNGLVIAAELFNSGFQIDQAVLITKEVHAKWPQIKGANGALRIWLLGKDIKTDSTKVADALRQGELLKHLNLDPAPAYEPLSLDLKASLNDE